MGLTELIGGSATAGIGAGAAFAAFDVLHHAPGLVPRDIVVAMALATAVATPATMLVTLALAAGLRAVGCAPSRRHWTGILIGSVVVGLTAAVVLTATKNHRDWSGLAVIAASFPVAALGYGIFAKCSWLDGPGRSIIAGLALLEALVVVLCGMATVRAWDASGIMLVPTGLAVAALLWAIPRLVRFPRAAGVTLGLCLPLTGLGFAAFGHPRPRVPSFAGGAAATAPNVVLIVLDTTRRDHLGCYGHPGGLTPALDNLAAESVLYERAFSVAPWTVPSHASMFTGLYPVTHGCSYEHHLWLDDEFVTLAEMLRDSGYQTISLNSNPHVRSCNSLQGFETSIFLRGPRSELALRRLSRAVGSPEDWVDKGGSAAVDRLAAWIAQDYDPASPFFLFLNLFETHQPYVPPRADRLARLPDGVSYCAATRFALGSTNTVVEKHLARSSDPSLARLVRGLYAAEVRYQDRRLGEVLSLLRTATDFDNTLVIVTADHGENLGEAGRWEHLFAINDTLIHVPLLIRYPRRADAGKRVPGLCQTVDLVPTVFGVLDRPCPVSRLPGRTLVPEHFESRTEVFAQVSPYYLALTLVEPTIGFKAGVHRFTAHHRVLHTGTLKYIWSSDGRHRLYDVGRDALETVNLVGRTTQSEELHDRLLDWWAKQPAYRPRDDGDHPVRPLDEQTIEQLRSLGYIGQ